MSPNNKSDRRRFFKNGLALAGLAVGAAALPASGQTIIVNPESAIYDPDGTRAYGKRSRFVTSVRRPSEDRAEITVQTGRDGGQRFSPLQDSVGIITASSLHFISAHSHNPPDIDPNEHRLMIHGMVDRPLVFTVDEIKRLPSVTRVHFLECAGNSSPRHIKQNKPVVTLEDFARPGTIQGLHGETSCSEWTGVELKLLLGMVGVQKGASFLVAEGAGWQHAISFPLSKGLDDSLIVYGQNGEPIRPENGFPLRLLNPGFQGMRNVKYIERIKVVDQPYYTTIEAPGYTDKWPSLNGKARAFQFQVGPKSVITYPSDVHRLTTKGFYEVTGLAWSGEGAVRRVEVSADAGRTWKDAKLQEPIHRKAYTRFRFDWNWNGDTAVLQSRCTDELGTVQPTAEEKAKSWGATKDWLLTAAGQTIHHNNSIQPWRIDRDGSVHNAMFA